jgi:DNA-dependent metalloprotease WSS1
MKFQRYNASEANPNPHICFITPLKGDIDSMTVALDILKALAAQVRPIMKKHG